MELRHAAYAAFLSHDLDEKVARVLALPSLAPLPFGLDLCPMGSRQGKMPTQNIMAKPDRQWSPPATDALAWELDVAHRFDEGAAPGRPLRPSLLRPDAMPKRAVERLQGHAALIHAVCHIEFNAINLALDAIWRFAGLPALFYWQWARVAVEEARHFAMLRAHLNALPLAQPMDYGDLPAHDGLWEMCVRTQDDRVARMALVPRTLEARGLDATPLIQSRLRQVDTPWAREAVGMLDQLLHDEVGHVAIGNDWYAWLCEQQGLAPLAHYRLVSRQHRAPRLKPPFNEGARQAAGFSEAEMRQLREPGALHETAS